MSNQVSKSKYDPTVQREKKNGVKISLTLTEIETLKEVTRQIQHDRRNYDYSRVDFIREALHSMPIFQEEFDKVKKG